MGIRISCDDRGVKLFRNEKEAKDGTKFYTYQISISYKDNINSEWISEYKDVVFKKDAKKPGNKSKIIIKDAFLTLSKYKDVVREKYVILDFVVLDWGDEVPEIIENPNATPNNDFIDIADNIGDELPFL